MHVCLKCYELYEREHLGPEVKNVLYCPKLKCSGRVVEIDEIILPSIIKLNQKGYKTTFCCAGHWYNVLMPNEIHAYVAFNTFYKFDSLPEGWGVDLEEEEDEGFDIVPEVSDEGIRVIRSVIVVDAVDDALVKIAQINANLLKWVSQLPDLNKKE